MTLEEILKSEGWTDADIAAQATLLNDPKFRGAVEKHGGAIASERDAYNKQNDGWATWHETTGKPALSAYEKQVADARAESASLKERLKFAEEQGYAPRRDEPKETPKEQPMPNGTFDYKAQGLITKDDLNGTVSHFADVQGQAIAMVADLTARYRSLTGNDLIDYSTQVDGRTLYGVEALRAEAIAAGKRIDEYAAQKFDFQGKQQARAEANRLKAEEAIRADERSKVAQQYGDPNVRPMMPSNNPFIPGKRENQGMPWEQGNSQDRRRERIQRALTTQVQ